MPDIIKDNIINGSALPRGFEKATIPEGLDPFSIMACPDPGPEMGEFLGYLLKRHGGNVTLKEAQRDWREIDIEKEVKKLRKKRLSYLQLELGILGTPFCLGIYKQRELHVIIGTADTEWADYWATIHESKRGHHTTRFKM